MKSLRHIALCLVVAAGLAACGGGDEEASWGPMGSPSRATLPRDACDPQSFAQGTIQEVDGTCVRANPLMRAHARPAPLAATAQFTPDMLMNWAETQFPTLFAPSSQPTQIWLPYTFRYYPATQMYLGVAGSDVYIMGPITNGLIAHVGAMSDFSCAAANIGCMVPSAPLVVGIKPYDQSAIIEFNPPASSGSSPVLSYGATCASGFTSIGTATSTTSPITVTGLTNGKTYSCIVTATNAQGTSAPSAARNVTPGMSSYQQTKIRLVSDGGDYIGGGATYEYTKSNASLSISASGGHLSVNVNADERWYGEFELPAGAQTWTPGTYTGLTRYPFNSSGTGGLSWSGEGRGCNTLKGSMTVRSATYNDGVLDSISLTFLQYCEGGTAALRGDIVWGANDPTAPPGPVNPIPTNLWTPATGAVPATGNYAYLKSDAGDYIGQGLTYLFTGSQLSNVSAYGGGVSVSVSGGGDYFTGTFVPMSTSTLQVGYYPDLSRWPFHNPMKGGLDWSGSGRGCNTLSGWFAIDELTIQSNAITHIKLRFEQHCEQGSTALRGQVNWTAP